MAGNMSDIQKIVKWQPLLLCNYKSWNILLSFLQGDGEVLVQFEKNGHQPRLTFIVENMACRHCVHAW